MNRSKLKASSWWSENEATYLEGAKELGGLMEQSEKLEDLAQDAASVEAEGSAGFMEPGTKVKKKRGPYKKTRDKAAQGAQARAETYAPKAEDTQAAMNAIPTKDIVKPMFQILSTWGTRMVKDDRAAMLPEELEAISTSGAMVLDKWAPLIAGQFAAEMMFTATLGTWMLRCYAIHAESERQRRERERKEPYSGPTESGPEIKRQPEPEFRPTGLRDIREFTQPSN